VRRFRRILLNVATGVSVVLCAVCLVLWARGAWVPATNADAVMAWKMDVTERGAHQRTLRLWSREGAVHLDADSAVFHAPPTGGPGGNWKSSPWRATRVGSESIEAADRGRDVLGFRLWHTAGRHVPSASVPYGTESRGVSVPYWALVWAFAVLPVARFWAARRRAGRRVAGCCAECGYDLRATPARCPECGAEVAVAPR
jgi:hypothetical protein